MQVLQGTNTHNVISCTDTHNVIPCTDTHNVIPLPCTDTHNYHVQTHTTSVCIPCTDTHNYHVPTHTTSYHVPTHTTSYHVPTHTTSYHVCIELSVSQYFWACYGPFYRLQPTPSQDLLLAVLSLVVEGPYSEEGSHHMANSQCSLVLIQWLPDIQSHDLQT
ncbi:hypothetical protein DPMN_183577 [Dreissena polymorpha]|uniref:Uncharacterized protein n=1 Tax=Dreissena polymorpha TaxID=45954 RepID=A0A9D4DG86_DREPO|nr:hypothetical protein DPMN_183577 [Dreissena polymorpha]